VTAVIAAARTSAAVFALADRAVLEVRGADRVTFLQGQLTNDVAALDPAGPRASCHALALTREGRIVAALRVVARPDRVWLETEASTATAARERLAKYVVADDVTIDDVTESFARIAVEGPQAQAALARAAGSACQLAPDHASELRLGGASVVAVAFSLTGRDGVQLFAPREASDEIVTALVAADAVEGDAIALETLRIEAGLPRAGAELVPDTLPAELHLVERSVSFTKGCFTGQEVVARMHSRGRVGHLLVGLVLAADAGLPEPGATLERDGTRVGSITSVVQSPSHGPIALAIVRKGHELPDTELHVGERAARVVALPFGTRAGSA
jgi:folate-binding protein YgfZ